MKPTQPRISLVLAALALAAMLLPAGARGQTSYPMLTSVYPLGCRRGAATEVVVTGTNNFAGASAVFFEHPGLAAEIVPPTPTPPADRPVNTVTLKIVTPADAPLGPLEFRVMTPRGLSTIGQLVVTDAPPVLEKEPNNTPATATPLSLPAGLDGRLQAVEDVDCFRFSARAGEEVVFSCLSGRLQDKIHDLNPGGGGAHVDPILVLLDAESREIASADDTWGADPLLAHRFEKAGDYVLQVRDVRYSGNAGWTYHLTCTNGPYVTALYPMAGRRGEEVEVEPVGYNLGGMTATRVRVPMMDPGRMDVQLSVGAERTNPLPFVVSDAPQFQESPENDDFARATAVEIPGGFNGRVERDADRDCFRFHAVKGQAYTFEVYSRRFGSLLDSEVQVVDAEGKVLKSDDDVVGRDSRLDWTAPSDGEFGLVVTDLHGRGGPQFVYHVAATAALPDFALQCDDDRALIGPGSGYALFIRSTRRSGFTGEIRLSVEGLPPGITAHADRVRVGMDQACVILRAAADVKPDFRRIRVVGTADISLPDGTSQTIRRVATPLQEIYMPGGGRRGYGVNTQVVSITEPSDVLLKLSANKLTLAPGGTASVDVEVVRQKGYDKNVVLDVYLRHLSGKFGDPLPPGVSLDEDASKTLLGPTETKGKIVLKAASTAAPIENLPIAVLGQVSINFVVKVSHASEPLLISVQKP